MIDNLKVMNKKIQIDIEKFYTPNEIVDLGIMSASNTDTKKQMLLRFIREGRMKALNLGGLKKPRYVVQGRHLVEYLNTQMKPGSYMKKKI